ncbi:hypothetical protein C8Q77DRAFT_479432 [Trametes polyzona]|nr:hypothetical protein C8Q77DRAFT_479432 [Trametes polyzona]
MASPSNQTVPAAGAAPALPALPALDNTFGAVFLGTSFGLILYGLTIQQAYHYFRLYPSDPLFLRSFVTICLLIETLHSVCSMHVVYHYLVSNYFNPLALTFDVWSLQTLTWVSGITIILAQSFYARRVYRLSEGWRYRILVAIAIVLIIVELGFTLAATAEGFILPTLAEYRKVAWLISVVYGVTVFCDILLAGSLTWMLLKKRTGFKHTDSLIQVIVLYTVNTGALTSMFGLVGFLLALIMPDNLIYIGVSLFGTKLYINSVLAVLNSRKGLNNRTNGLELNTFDENGFPSSHGGSSGSRNRSNHLGSALRMATPKVAPFDIQVHVNKEAVSNVEDESGDDMSKRKAGFE